MNPSNCCSMLWISHSPHTMTNNILCTVPFRKPNWYLTVSFRSNLRFGKRYTLHKLLIYAKECDLVCSWILCFFKSFLCTGVISAFLKFDGNTEDAMILMRLRKKKSAKISLLITLEAISVSWQAFFTSNLFISLVISSRDTCLILKALSLWFSNILTTLEYFLNLIHVSQKFLA